MGTTRREEGDGDLKAIILEGDTWDRRIDSRNRGRRHLGRRREHKETFGGNWEGRRETGKPHSFGKIPVDGTGKIIRVEGDSLGRMPASGKARKRQGGERHLWRYWERIESQRCLWKAE